MIIPETAPILLLIIILVMIVGIIISIPLFIIVIIKYKRSKNLSSSSIILLAIAIIPYLWMIFEIIHYNIASTNLHNNCVGKYYHENSDVIAIELKENSDWEGEGLFPCSKGNWELITSEDGFYIKFGCKGKNITEHQAPLGKDNTLIIYHNVFKKKN